MIQLTRTFERLLYTWIHLAQKVICQKTMYLATFLGLSSHFFILFMLSRLLYFSYLSIAICTCKWESHSSPLISSSHAKSSRTDWVWELLFLLGISLWDQEPSSVGLVSHPVWLLNCFRDPTAPSFVVGDWLPRTKQPSCDLDLRDIKHLSDLNFLRYWISSVVLVPV